ncbi:MAG: hypothetical protein Q9209_004490 [Squamulea sp. 1 TL-2023]
MSYVWGSGQGCTSLTKSNMESLKKGIRPSEMQGHWYAALLATKSLGIRYLWIDALCDCGDDLEERLDTILRIADIYSSAALVVCDAGGGTAGLDRFSIDTSILLQPLSFFFNWSEPSEAENYRKRLQTPLWACCSRAWMQPELSLYFDTDDTLSTFFPGHVVRFKSSERRRLKIRWSRVRNMDTQEASSETEHPHIQQSRADFYEETRTSYNDIDWEKAESQLKRGISCAEAGKPFEALACFMIAKDCVSAFSTLTTRAREVYSTASMYIASIYTTQELPEVAQDIMLPALEIYRKLPESGRGMGILQFSMGTIYDALGKHEESLNSYNEAKKIFDALSESQEQELSTWNAVLNLKLAKHHVRTKKFKEAHALLQQCLDYFQSREDSTAQAHLARAIFWQSLVFEAEGSKFMAKAMHAAAKDALIAVRGARERNSSDASASFFAEDFDEEGASNLATRNPTKAKAAWREMSVKNIESLVRIADKIHPNLPESNQVFAERVKLFPEGCLALVEDEGDDLCGYVISHPIRRRQPPALDSLLGEIASDADQYYIHDLAILPDYRGYGLAQECIRKLFAIAKRYPTTSLVSVYNTAPFWGRFGFVPQEKDEGLEKNLLDYGDDAIYLERINKE